MENLGTISTSKPRSRQILSGSGDPIWLMSLQSRIRTGCVYELQPRDTFGLLVTRDDPRLRWKDRRMLAPIHAHWPTLAPSVLLLTGHKTSCHSRHCRGDSRCAEHVPLQLRWPAFAAAYRAELEQCPLIRRLVVIGDIVEWLQAFPTVTVLSFEQGKLHRNEVPYHAVLADLQDQPRAHYSWAQRHIFRDWLVSLLPLATVPGAGSPRPHVAGARSEKGGIPRQIW
jgi:hypothetical protein